MFWGLLLQASLGQEDIILSAMWPRGSPGGEPLAQDFTERENVSMQGDAMASVMSQVFEKSGGNTVYKGSGVSGDC